MIVGPEETKKLRFRITFAANGVVMLILHVGGEEEVYGKSRDHVYP